MFSSVLIPSGLGSANSGQAVACGCADLIGVLWREPDVHGSGFERTPTI